MPRNPRNFQDGLIYHVLNRENSKKVVFHNTCDYRGFLKLIEDSKKNFAIDLFAYCLMPNHFHFVLRPRIAEHLSKWMHWLMTNHVQRYRVYYQSIGHVWQNRYKHFIIQQDDHFLTVLRYAERNPMRANLVPSAKDWPWSSFKERMKNAPNSIIDIPPIDLPDDWGEFVDQPLTDKELESIRYSVNRQAPFGNARWQKRMCRELGLEHTLRPRGRPKKKKSVKGNEENDREGDGKGDRYLF
jgi:putative transposase